MLRVTYEPFMLTYTECRYAECHYAECSGAILTRATYKNRVKTFLNSYKYWTRVGRFTRLPLAYYASLLNYFSKIFYNIGH